MHLQLFTQGEITYMFLALAVLQPKRNSVLLFFKSMMCYMKMMILQNPHNTSLISCRKMEIKLVVCALPWHKFEQFLWATCLNVYNILPDFILC